MDLPSTILSRCQRFDFRRIPPEDIAKRLLLVSQNEQITLAEDAAMLIARIADGALRDALSILDQCASFSEDISVNTVSKAAGLLGRDYLFEISDAIKNQDSSTILNIIDRLHASSCDMERLVSELVNHFRNIMIVKTTKRPEEFVVCTPDELNRYREFASDITYGTILYIMETLCTESSQLKYSAHQRAKVETTLIRLCSPALSTDNSALVARIDELQAQIMMLKANGVSATPVTSQPQQTESIRETRVIEENSPTTETIHVSSESPLQSEEPQHTRDEEPPLPPEPPVTAPIIEEPVAPKAPVDMTLVTESDKALPFTSWNNCVEQFGKINKPLYPMLQGSEAFRAGNTVFIKSKSPAFPALFKNKSNFDQIQEAIMRATGEKLRPAIYSDGESPAANENAEPVDVLISKLSKMQIDFIVEE